MIAHRSSQSLLKIAAFLLIAAQSYGEIILSLTFDDPNGVFAAHSEGISPLDMQTTPTIGEAAIASGFGGRGQLMIETGWVDEGGEPPKSLQLIADPAMGTKGFLRLINSKQVRGTRGFVAITPNGMETSLASLSQIENGRVILNGGLDLFFRYSEENPSQQELVPNVLYLTGEGIRLIVESDEGSIVAVLSDGKDESSFDTDLDGTADASRVKTSIVNSAPIDSEAVYHLAIAFQTSEAGVVSVKVFLKAGNGAINTREETDLVSQADFSIITDNLEKSLEKAGFSIGADSRSSPEKAVLDLAAFRIFKPAPEIFPDLSGQE
jgi:hypothetical protein